MSDLLPKSSIAPLAEALRPKTLDGVIGQRHLIGEGKPLRLAFDSGVAHSMILCGPPGVGKTTVARLLAQAFGGEFIALSAVFSGVKDIRAAMERAEHNLALDCRTILFIDEIHRFNKAQQDALLPYAESGLVTLIGATTENPSFEVTAALLSRTRIYVLQPLNSEELTQLFTRTQAQTPNAVLWDVLARDLLIDHADGDARRLLNLFEQAQAAAIASGLESITRALLEQMLTLKQRRFDKGGDLFYDQVSALHKSVRGSDPDAALYWLCRLLDGGIDVKYLCRRLVRMAWEDIGLADPRALQLVNEAVLAYERLGSPEGELALGEAVLYLAVAAKSNAAYLAFQQAMACVKEEASHPVPLHLRNAPTAWMRQQGYGQGYRYAHDEEHGIAAGENYWPVGVMPRSWYKPVPRGLEAKIAEKMAFLKKCDDAARKNGD